MVALFQVKLFDQIRSLTAIETCNHVKGLVVKCQGGMEIPSSIQICYLGPSICRHIINFTFVHAFRWQRGSYREYLTLLLLNQYTCKGVSSPLK